jgi:hypothetical protein
MISWLGVHFRASGEDRPCTEFDLIEIDALACINIEM